MSSQNNNWGIYYNHSPPKQRQFNAPYCKDPTTHSSTLYPTRAELFQGCTQFAILAWLKNKKQPTKQIEKQNRIPAHKPAAVVTCQF